MSSKKIRYSTAASIPDKRKERSTSASSASRKWGSSARNVAPRRQWASPDHDEQWKCQQCSYQNADPRNRLCVLCGWNREQKPSCPTKNSKSILIGSWPPSPIPESPAETNGSNLPLQLLEPPKIPKASSLSSNSSLNEEDDSIGTIRTSNLGAILEGGDKSALSSNQTSDPRDPSPGDILLYDDNDSTQPEDTFQDEMLTPRPASHFLYLEADSSSGDSTSPDSEASGNNINRSAMWSENGAAATSLGQDDRKKRRQYFQCCSNQKAMLATASVLFVLSIIFIIVAATIANKNNSGGGSTPSGPEWPPTDEWPPQTNTPESVPSRSPSPEQNTPTITPLPTPSPTMRPTPPDSVALTVLGNDISGDEIISTRTFGSLVAFSDDGLTLATSALNGAILDGSRPGVVLVYKYVQDEWIQLGQTLQGFDDVDRFGQSLSLSKDGSTIAIGGPENDDAGEKAGMAVVYRYDAEDNIWIPLGSSPIFGSNANDRLGVSISLAGNGAVLAVGTETHVEVYEYDEESSAWVVRGKIIENGTGSNDSGWAVSLSDSGSTLAVGGPGRSPGYAQVLDYDSETGDWVPRGTGLEGSFEGDENIVTAPAVSLSGNGEFVAIRVRSNDQDQDSPVQVFATNRETGAWTPLGDSIVGEGYSFKEITDRYPGDPRSVETSSDGGFVAVNGYDSPLVYWYNEGTDTWRMLLEESDQLPRSVDIVSLSGNGLVMAVSDLERGRVRVFQIE